MDGNVSNKTTEEDSTHKSSKTHATGNVFVTRDLLTSNWRVFRTLRATFLRQVWRS